jgi:dihydroorotate dehydrogenase electron transfer subunit
VRKYSDLARIHSVISHSDKVFAIDLEYPEIALTAQPGQFIQLKLPQSESCLWPRPFSIHKAVKGLITISIKKAGRMTSIMEKKKPGEMVYITGPLGNSFDIPPSGQDIYFAAGGVGLPPLQFLAEKLLAQGYPPNTLHFYSGARTRDELFGHEELRSLAIEYIAATDDGSQGISGFVTEPLAVELIRRRTAEPDFNPIIYGCGPIPMLKKLAEICYGLTCYLSLEQLMPCGWGVCNGCAVKIKKNDSIITEDERGFRLARVCREGPVFEASEIIWE